MLGNFKSHSIYKLETKTQLSLWDLHITSKGSGICRQINSEQLHTISRDGANEGSFELYIASLGNT